IENMAPAPYECGNRINGGLTVKHISTGATLAIGETNANCGGGRINGRVVFRDNSNAFLELDGALVNGGILAKGNTGGGEIEGNTVHGGATCSNNTPAFLNDGDGGPNSYTGNNNGCPT